MRSPDPFSDDHESNDSFENYVSVSSDDRRRSEAIESFEGFSGSDQVTVIENPGNDTVLVEENVGVGDEKVDLDDTITRMLNSTDEERDDEEMDPENDALANLFKSFSEGEQREMNRVQQDGEDNILDKSIDVFNEMRDHEEHLKEREEEEPDRIEEYNEFITIDVPMLPVMVPNQNDVQYPKRKRRIESSRPSTSCQPSACSSDGPAVIIESDTGQYWNQPKTINIHGQNFEINSFNDYMRMKITKLNHQVNSEKSKPHETVSDTLKGYSVFVNGYTDPPALVIRDLMLAHGGEYHCYYQHGITTYTIASSIASAKINRIRENEIFIKADWITESIAARKPLDYRDFLIYEKGSQEKGQMKQFLSSSVPQDTGITTTSTSSNMFLDARNPNFIRDYYARSRLHLISTLAQDMKDFVANLKMEGKMTKRCFPEEELIQMGQKQTSSYLGNVIFHVDLDCFFVSVAVRDRNDLKVKEVAITHSKGTISNSMSEIASCSYAARNCGVKNGMLMRDALQRCPQLTLLPYQFDDYVQVSRQIYHILASYTLELRAVSCDEMYINMSNLCEKYGIQDPVLIAEHIRKQIREKTKCPASVGIGSTSLLARLATRHAKPDGIFWVTEEKKEEFIKEEKVRDLPGLGYEMMNRLTSFFGEMTKCYQLQKKTEKELIPVFGPKLATRIFKQCRGIEDDPADFWKTHIRKSVSCDINYGIRFTKKEEVLQLMTAIGAELERKLTESNMIAGSITLKLMVRSADAPLQTAKFMGHGICDTYTKSCNIAVATSRGDVLTSESMKLYSKVLPKVEDLRGVGVTCGKLKSKLKKDAATVVLEMFGKGKNDCVETQEAEKSEPQTNQQVLLEDDNESDHFMREKIADSSMNPPSCPNRRIRSIPHPSEMRVANEINIPDILRLSKSNVTKSVKTYEIEETEDVEWTEKYYSDLESILQNEPTKDSVLDVYEMLSTALNSGKLLTFQRLFRKFEDVSINVHCYPSEWFPVFHSMLPQIKEESKSLLEFPMGKTQKSLVENTNRKETTDDHQKQRIPREVFVIDSTNSSVK
uniref:DNA repair protein REV1 n=1 Tax=Caenorhabditis tropicalis TaxID=1561998 RepID=A0A1I7T7I1_9PELO